MAIQSVPPAVAGGVFKPFLQMKQKEAVFFDSLFYYGFVSV